MIKTDALTTSIAIILITLVSGSWTSASAEVGISEQISKLKITAPTQQMVDDLNLDPFYKKSLDLDGFTIVSSEKVNDYALKETAFLIKKMLQHRPDVLQKLAENKVRFVIMAHDEFVSQIPEYKGMEPAKFWDRRARGLGPNHHRPVVSCGEENILCFAGDPYRQESIHVHEFAHAIMDMALVDLDPDFNGKLQAAYDDAMAKGLWKDKYAANNHREYWAEAVQSYFDDNRPPDRDHNHVNTRKELFEYDPVLANIVKEQLGDIEWKYKKPADREANDTLHLVGYEAEAQPEFAWPQELLEWYDNYMKQKKSQDNLISDYFRKLKAGGPSEETAEIAKALIKDSPASELNGLAWDILTLAEKPKRDLETALAAAAKSNEMTGHKNPSYLDTYALALFESGNIDEAINTQQKAIDLLPAESAKMQYSKSLNKYKAAKK